MHPQEARGEAPVRLGLLSGGQGLLLAQSIPIEAGTSPQSLQKININRVTVHYKYFYIH